MNKQDRINLVNEYSDDILRIIDIDMNRSDLQGSFDAVLLKLIDHVETFKS